MSSKSLCCLESTSTLCPALQVSPPLYCENVCNSFVRSYCCSHFIVHQSESVLLLGLFFCLGPVGRRTFRCNTNKHFSLHDMQLHDCIEFFMSSCHSWPFGCEQGGFLIVIGATLTMDRKDTCPGAINLSHAGIGKKKSVPSKSSGSFASESESNGTSI